MCDGIASCLIDRDGCPDIIDSPVPNTNTLTAGLIEKNWSQVITVMTCSRAETLGNLSTFGIDGGISTTDLQMGLLVQELEDPGIERIGRACRG